MCETCPVIYYQEQKKWQENVIFTIHVLSRLTALLTWAATLGWTSAVTCCNIYRESPVVFTSSYVHRFCSSHHSTIVFHVKCNQIQSSYYMDDIFCSILFYSVWHVTVSCYQTPLYLWGLYSIRAQNGYGQRRPCKIVLLTLVASRGVTDLCLSWGINIEHARTAYHKTFGTTLKYQQPYRRHVVHKHHISIGT